MAVLSIYIEKSAEACSPEYDRERIGLQTAMSPTYKSTFVICYSVESCEGIKQINRFILHQGPTVH